MKFKNKSGMEMSLSVIVIAVILLVVLAVMMFIFFRSSNTFKEGVSACDGTCVTEASQCQPIGPAIPMNCKVGGDTTGSLGNFCCRRLG